MRNTGEIFFGHDRYLDAKGRIASRGGLTIAFKQVDGGVEYAYARCHENDAFVKKAGRIKAAGRLQSPRYATRLNMDVTDMNPAEVCDHVIEAAWQNIHSK